jgi:hypothetical protein
MIVVPTEQKGFDAIEKLIGQNISWLNDEAIEWNAKAGRRSSAKPDKKTKDKPSKDKSTSKQKNNTPVAEASEQPHKHNEAPKQNDKRGRKSFHEQVDLEYTDTDHAFGGEEHIPAFLR